MMQTSRSIGPSRRGLRWAIAVLLLLAAPCFFVLGAILCVSWTAEPGPVAPGTVRLLMTLGFISVALAPASIAGAGYLIWTAHRRSRPA